MTHMNHKAFQDYYPDELSHCYGCGRLNEHGLKLKSYWDGEQTVATFWPSPYHMAIPGYVYGGLLASIIDCPFLERVLDIFHPLSLHPSGVGRWVHIEEPE